MKGNFFGNTVLLVKLLGISRTSMYKAIAAGKVPRNDKGELLLDCPYIQGYMGRAGITDVAELYAAQQVAEHQQKKRGPKKPGYKAEKKKPLETKVKPAEIQTARASIGAIKSQAKQAGIPRGDKKGKPPEEKDTTVTADLTHLARQKMEYEVELQKKKMEEWEIKLKKMNGEMIDRVEVRKVYQQTFHAVDTSIRNSQGTGVGEKLNRLTGKLKDKSDRERVAAFNNLYSKIINEVLDTAYKTMMGLAVIPEEV